MSGMQECEVCGVIWNSDVLHGCPKCFNGEPGENHVNTGKTYEINAKPVIPQKPDPSEVAESPLERKNRVKKSMSESELLTYEALEEIINLLNSRNTKSFGERSRDTISNIAMEKILENFVE